MLHYTVYNFTLRYVTPRTMQEVQPRRCSFRQAKYTLPLKKVICENRYLSSLYDAQYRYVQYRGIYQSAHL